MYIFVCSPGRSGTKFISQIFENITDIPSFHGGEKKIREIVDTGYYKNGGDKKILENRLNHIKTFKQYFESCQIFIHKLVEPILKDDKINPLYVINLIRNPLEVAVSYENRNSFPSNSECLWRLYINDSTRILKINIKLSIFQENLVDWIDTQMKFEKYKDQFDKYYLFNFENLNNVNELNKLFKFFSIGNEKSRIKNILDLNKLNKNVNNKPTIITEKHKKETKELIIYLKTLDNYPKTIIDTYFINL
jgi:hypothetical protein